MKRLLSISESRHPLGAYTWIARFRDGTHLIEFETVEDEAGVKTDLEQVSFSRVAERDDVAEVRLIPWRDTRSEICIQVAPGEKVKKVWTRTHQLNLDTDEQHELPVIDSFVLLSALPVFHYCYQDGTILITTSEEPR